MVRIDRREKINSLLAAAVIAETNVCAITSAFVTIPMVSVLLMAAILASCLFINGKRIQLAPQSTIAFILFGILLVFSMLINGFEVAGERFLYFITFGFTAMMVVSVRQNPRLILKYLLYIYAVHLIVYFLFQRNAMLDAEDYWYVQMGIAYGFVPPVIISFIYLLYRKKLEEEGVLSHRRLIQVTLLASIFIVSAYVFLIDCGTRGVIVVAFVGIFFICIRKLSRKQRLILGLGGGALLIFLYINWDTILVSSLDRFSEGNVKSLVKLSQMTESGDVSNGRESHYNVAISMIKDSPIIGYGVGHFENVVKASYVHQLFLELLLECGIIGMILFLIPIIRLIRKTKNDPDDINYSFKVFLLSCCFLPLMFSASFWLYPPFWYGYFYATNLGYKQSLKRFPSNNIIKYEHSQQV